MSHSSFPPEELTREMSALPADVARGLAVAFPGRVSGGPLKFRIEPATTAGMEPALVIDLTPGPERRIALLRLPTLVVRLRFEGGDGATRKRMLSRFDLAMRRGGG